MQKISLTRNELIYLDDCFTVAFLADINEGILTILRPIAASAAIDAPEDLVIKIGGALIEAYEDSKDSIDVFFENNELFIIREVAHSSARIGTELVGLSLKIKVHKAILSALAEDVFEDFTHLKKELADNLPIYHKKDIIEKIKDWEGTQ